MQKDFHYNMTLALAVKAGIDLETAKLIAWSNQFTDDCKDFKKYGIRTMVDITWQAGDCFVPEVQRSVFVAFHFLPGSKNSLIVRPDCELAVKLIERAANASDPIALGIALHSYQDTFSHEGFSGIQDDNNAKYKWDKTGLSSFAPRIGHAEFGHDPDIIYDGNKIDNRNRASDAAVGTMRLLQDFSADHSIGDPEEYLLKELEPFWEISSYDQRKIWLMNWADIPTVFGYKNIHAGRTEEHKKHFVQAAKKQQSIVAEYLVNSE